MRVLVVGDPYMPVPAFASALAGLGPAVTVSELQIDSAAVPSPRTESERALREYAGDPADIARAVAGHDVLIVHGAPVSAEVLDAAPLRLVCCARGGPVNVDVAAATQRGIPVVNTPGKNAEAVAELTIAFALLLIRAVPRASRHLADGGGFAESVFEGGEFFGREAPGTTLGLVGFGNVGREVAVRARGLGFTPLAYDPQPPAGGTGGVELVSLPDLLSRSDIVSLHARATPANRHMFSAQLFAQMRPGAFFINTARESLVDEAALGAALERGQLGGAALDVMEAPPAGHRHPLLSQPNVFVTPHIGGATAETLRRGAELAAAGIADLLAGRVPANLVNPQVLGAQVAPPALPTGRGSS
ncbi:MAG TPA: NAD(P)-dependent oxidoreductase [Streptosporangiaceae bacterium]|nr:NAD(P)-dependent oxidoreductase [Streptosporangiaceae bacterium]